MPECTYIPEAAAASGRNHHDALGDENDIRRRDYDIHHPVRKEKYDDSDENLLKDDPDVDDDNNGKNRDHERERNSRRFGWFHKSDRNKSKDEEPDDDIEDEDYDEDYDDDDQQEEESIGQMRRLLNGFARIFTIPEDDEDDDEDERPSKH